MSALHPPLRSRARASVACVLRAVALVCGVGGSLACVEPPAPPQAPQLGDVESPTSSAVQAIIGTKQAGTSIAVSVNRGAPVLVKLDDDTQWTAVVALAEGTNEIAAVAVDAAGRASSEASTVILLDTAPPQAPVVDPPPARTSLATLSVTGTVTPGDEVLVNGAALGLGSAATSFAAAVDLAFGDNVIRVAARDIAGNESAVQDFVVERIDGPPFTLDDPPTVVNRDQLEGLTISGTRGDGVEVSVDDDVVVDAAVPSGAWSAVVALVNGENAFTVTGAFADEPATAVSFDVVVQADLVDPLLDVTSPAAGALVGAIVSVEATSSDAQGPVQVSACVGTCDDFAAFVPLVAQGAAFVGALDIATNADVEDGALVDVVVRVVDSAGNDVLRTTSVLVFRAPIGVAGLAGVTSAIDLAPDAIVGGALAWTNEDGVVGATLDAGGGGWAPVDVSLAAASGSAPRIARTGATTHIVWLEGGDLMYASDDGVAHLVTSGATDAVTSADVTFDADDPSGDTAFIAFVQADAVRTTSGAGDTWGAPVTISDAATASATGVVVAEGGVAVAWLETSDRDGALDDADVVVVGRAGAPSAPTLVSADQGAFVDGASSALHGAVLSNGEVVLAWIDGTRGVVARVDVGAAPVIGTPLEVTNVAGHGVATSIFVESDILDGGNVLVGWLDDGVPLLSGASAPAFIARRGPLAALGAPLVVSTAPASSPAGFLEGTIAQLAWIEGGDVLLVAVELP